MKYITRSLVALSLLFSIFLNAQQGINYKALIKDSGGNVVANQSIDIQFQILQGAGLSLQYQETHSSVMTDANGIVIVNIGEGSVDSGVYADIDWGADDHYLNVQIDIGGGLTDMGTTQFMAVPYANQAWNVTGLESLDEGNGLGWRLIGTDPANYGSLGLSAVDLSFSNANSSVFGATGNYASALGAFTEASNDYTLATGNSTEASGQIATAMGTNTLASGFVSTALGRETTASGSYATSMGDTTKAESYASVSLGRYNIGGGAANSWIATDPLFEIGIGTGDLSRSNALTVIKNGTITAPEFSVSEIDAAGNPALITKEYADTHYTPTGLEVLDEGNGTGWRLIGRDPANHGDIGEGAVDLSYYNSASSTHGATGNRSVAMGWGTIASGIYSTAFGFSTTASSSSSIAIGDMSLASAPNSLSIGDSTIASGQGALAMGFTTTASGSHSTALGYESLADSNFSFAAGYQCSATDLFSTAIGTNSSSSGSRAVALGYQVDASGFASLALGYNTDAIGSQSTAMGHSSSATEFGATSMGYLTVASGQYSTSAGHFTKAESLASTSIGLFNIAGGTSDSWIGTDPLFEIGNGTGDLNRSNAITVLKNGTITAPDFSISEINTAGNTALITKEYADSNYSPTGLESLDEGNGGGWRLIGQNPDNFGNIGSGAVDISIGTAASTTRGATGANALAFGVNTMASGTSATAMGLHTQALEAYSMATGYFSVASGRVATAMGRSTSAEAFSSFTIGRYNIGGGDPINWVSADPLFEIGIGATSGSRANAATVLKNGNVGIGTNTPNTKLQVTGGSDASLSNGSGFAVFGPEDDFNIVIDNNEIMARNNGAASNIFFQNNGGDVYVGGGLVHSSDRRLKKDIESLNFGLNEILQLNPVSYRWKKETNAETKTIGLIAQEVELVLQELVGTNEQRDNTLTLNYEGLIPVLIKAIQEQQEIIEEQDSDIKELTARLQKVERLIGVN